MSEAWEARPRHPALPGQPVDFGDWHKENCPRWAYCMDLDSAELGTRVDWRKGEVYPAIVGIYELIRWSHPGPLHEAPAVYPPHVGKRFVLYEMERRFPGVPVFFAWRRDDMSEVLILPAHHFPPMDQPPMISAPLVLSGKEFATFLANLPAWPASPCPKCGGAVEPGQASVGDVFSFEARVMHQVCPLRRV